MLGPGEQIPAATVWTRPNERRALTDVVADGDGPALLLFYLFDWSST